MKKRFLVVFALCIVMLIICTSCGKPSVEIQEDKEFAEIEYSISEPYGSDDIHRPESALLDFLEKTETEYTLVTEPCGLMNGEVVTNAQSVQIEVMNQEIEENQPSSANLQKVIDAAAYELDLILNLSDPTNIMPRFGLGDEGRAEMEDYYGGFIKYYKDHKLKTTCDIRFEKMIYNPFDCDVPQCFAIKFIVDITTEKGEGDLSRVEYIPEVGETKTVEICTVGMYENGYFYPHVLKIENVEFGRKY